MLRVNWSVPNHNATQTTMNGVHVTWGLLHLYITQLLSLQWRHNVCDSVSNHQPHDCLLNRLFIRRSKKTSKLRVTGLCAGNLFAAQMASYAKNVSIWWRHHVPRRKNFQANLTDWCRAEVSVMILPSSDCHWTLLIMITHHRFVGAILHD